MSIKPVIQGKAAEAMEQEARRYGVTSTALVKAIIDAVVRDKIVQPLLVGVDVESYQDRKRSRPVIWRGKEC